MRLGVRTHGRRHVAGAMWGPPSDPQVYGDLDVDATAALDYIARVRAATGVRLTPTHLATRAVGRALATVPQVNGRIAFGRFDRHETADVFVVVALDEGRDLSGVKIRSADAKSAVQVAEELETRAGRMRAGDDRDLGRTKTLLDTLPGPLITVGMRLADLAVGGLGLDLPALGLPYQPFGGAMVTSVGMLGIDHAYSALCPYYRVGFIVLVGEITDKPVVVGGQVVARPTLSLTATIDHRYLDGFQAAQVAHALRDYLREPEVYEPDLPRIPRPRARTGVRRTVKEEQ